MNRACRWTIAILLGALALGAAAGSARDATTWPADLRIDAGRLRGVRAGEVLAFKGIPYAAAPVGALRWRAPQPEPKWRGVRDAGQFGNACIQEGPSFKGEESLGANESEDCLYLNVWRPAGAARDLPVMFYIHGGAFLRGASSQPMISGDRLAKRGVVVVSINYRMGWFGIFGHPALTREAADGGRLANYGLMDQVAALRWVQRNVRAFGGDPARVTIFGESAGAASVLALLVTPEARGLFAGAISESGYWRGPWARVGVTAPDGRKSAEESGVTALAAIGVRADSAAALRALSTEQLRKLPGHGFEGANFVLDGKLLPEDLWVALRAGHEAPVPLLIGANDLETPIAATPEAQARRAKFLLPFLSEQEQVSLAPAYGGEAALGKNLASDFTFAAHAWSIARLHRSHGFPAYRYRFAALSDAMAAQLAGTPHAGELPYVFGTLEHAHWAMGERDAKASDVTMRYWIGFANTGTLQPPGLPACPLSDGDMILRISNEGPFVEVDDRAARYRALAALLDPRS